MLSKIRNSKVVKYLITALAISCICAMGCINCFAAEGGTLQDALTTAFTTVKNDILGYMGAILPIALGVVGAFFGIKKAIAFFRSTANK